MERIINGITINKDWLLNVGEYAGFCDGITTIERGGVTYQFDRRSVLDDNYTYGYGSKVYGVKANGEFLGYITKSYDGCWYIEFSTRYHLGPLYPDGWVIGSKF